MFLREAHCLCFSSHCSSIPSTLLTVNALPSNSFSNLAALVNVAKVFSPVFSLSCRCAGFRPLAWMSLPSLPSGTWKRVMLFRVRLFGRSSNVAERSISQWRRYRRDHHCVFGHAYCFCHLFIFSRSWTHFVGVLFIALNCLVNVDVTIFLVLSQGARFLCCKSFHDVIGSLTHNF